MLVRGDCLVIQEFKTKFYFHMCICEIFAFQNGVVVKDELVTLPLSLVGTETFQIDFQQLCANKIMNYIVMTY